MANLKSSPNNDQIVIIVMKKLKAFESTVLLIQTFKKNVKISDNLLYKAVPRVGVDTFKVYGRSFYVFCTNAMYISVSKSCAFSSPFGHVKFLVHLQYPLLNG